MSDSSSGSGSGHVARTPAQDQPPPPDGIRRLWAPWRYAYIAGGDPVEGCPFCVLPGRDPDDDRGNLIIHRGERCYVIFNAYPYNPGHLMVVPFAHEGDLEALGSETSVELWGLGERCVSALRDRLGAGGINLGMNLGDAAGAGVSDHLHLHVVPRWAGDTNFMSVAGATRVLPRALEEVYDELAPAFDARS